VAVIDSASATASALAGLLEIHGLAAPTGNQAYHRQLTTGDVEAFRRISDRLFDGLFPTVERIAVAGAA
jgi:glutamate racemase